MQTNRTGAVEAKTNVHGLRELDFVEAGRPGAKRLDVVRFMTNPTNGEKRDLLVLIDGPNGGTRGTVSLSLEQARVLADWLPYVLNEPARSQAEPDGDLLDIHDARGFDVAFEVGGVIEEHGVRASVSLTR